MPIWVSALLALVALPLRAASASDPSQVLLLAPAEAHASLTASHFDAAPSWSVEASSGNILVIQAISVAVSVGNVNLANLSSVQVTWTPEDAPVSSTFDRLFGVSAFPFLFSTGVHVRATTTSPGLIEANDVVRALMQAAPEPLKRLVPALHEDKVGNSLARSLCASAGFTRHVASGHGACFSASFPSPTTDDLDKLVSFPAQLVGGSRRLLAMTLRPPPVGSSTVAMDILSAVVTSTASIDSSSFTSEDKPISRLMVVKELDTEKGVVSVLSVDDGTESVQQVGAPAEGEIAVAVHGEGFHRRVHVQLSVSKLCTDAEHKALLLVPLSASVYADLDELRRMERFGELKLHSPTKHIEIERPTAVSSQHAIALEFKLDNAKGMHTLEFPIHLRYQSPSNATFYAPATMTAPEVFVSCDTGAQHATLTGPLSQWIPYETQAISWRRVIPSVPLVPMTVSVPVGFTPHGPFVSAVTISVTALSALLLVYVSLTAPGRTIKVESMWKPKTE